MVVTGGSGYSGHVIAGELTKMGHDVLSIDRRPPEQRICNSMIVDIRDYGQVVDALKNSERVVHFAGIPGTGAVPNCELYRINAAGTFNVLDACATLGVEQVIFASSIEIYAYSPATRDFEPFAYLPLDEKHPALPVNPYAAAKQGAELLCSAYSRMVNMSTVSLRLTKLMRHTDYHLIEGWGQDLQRGKELVWSYVDVRDIARMCNLIFEHPELKGTVLNAGAADTIVSEDTQQIAQRVYPDTAINKRLSGRDTLFSIDRARELLGFEPQYSWTQYV